MKGETAVGIGMKGETAAEEGMKVGTDFTETGPAAVMAGDKGQIAGAEAHTMTREDTMLVGTAVEITETAVGIGMKGEIAGIERIIIGIGEIIAQTGEIEAGGRHERSQSRGRHDRSQSRGRNSKDSDVKCFRCGKHGHIAVYCKDF